MVHYCRLSLIGRYKDNTDTRRERNKKELKIKIIWLKRNKKSESKRNK